MIAIAACLGLGYAALLLAAMMHGWQTAYLYFTGRTQSGQPIFRQLGYLWSVVGIVLLWSGMAIRAIVGRGWPIVSPADNTTVLALLAFSWYLIWSWLAPQQRSDLPAILAVILLLSYGLSQFPLSILVSSSMSKPALWSQVLTLCAGSWLALAAVSSLTMLIGMYTSRASFDVEERSSEIFVRIALLCLAVSLAIDTWWLQQVGLGNENDAQQAGIAVGWIIYFGALRLRSSARWRGWPWASIVIVGFLCMLPILIDVPWLEKTLTL